MLIDYKLGQGSIVLRVKLQNSSVSTGAGLTGLTSASSGLIIAAIADNEATTTAYTQAGSTIESITTLGAFAAPTATKCRFKEVDSTNHKGVYEVQIADARFAVTSAKSVMVSFSGATNLAERDVVIPLRSVDPYDVVRMGMTSLPNAVAAASGGLPTFGTGTGQINPDGSGSVPIAMAQSLPANPTANTTGESLYLADLMGGRVGTAQAGGATTITLDSGASSDSTSYVGDSIFLYGGTGGGYRGVGQQRGILSYDGSTKIATVDRAWSTNPDSTSKFMTIRGGIANAYLWRGTAIPATATAGIPDVNVKNINNVAAATPGAAGGLFIAGANAATSITTALTANIIGNITGNLSGSAGSVTGLTTTTIATAVWQDATAGDFTVSSSIGKSLYTSGVVPGGTNGLFIAGTNAATTITSALTTTFTGNLTGNVGGNVTGSIGSVASGGITTASFASGAINAAAIATDAIGSAEFSQAAADKIWDTAARTLTSSLDPSAAAIATAVWQDATAGDFTTASSIGKSLYTSGVVPGANGGHFIAGTNAATVITTSLTTAFTGSLTGNVGGNVTGNVSGNVVGDVQGKVIGGGSSTLTAVGVQSDLQTVKTQAVTCAAGVTVNSNVGTTQPINFTGTGASALAKGDVVDIAGVAVDTTAAQLGVNVVNIKGDATAATGLKAMGQGAILCTVKSSPSSGSSFSIQAASGYTLSSTDSFYSTPDASLIVCTSGTNKGKTAKVSAYTGSSGALTLSPGFPATPAQDDEMFIIGFSN